VFGVVTSPSAQAQTFTDLYNFTGSSDGGHPYAGLVRDGAGNLYGTTYDAGSGNYGVVFKVDTAGTETVLYNFTGGTDGGYPYAGVIRDAKGNLYGTTYSGGASGFGTVYKVNRKGVETVLYSFGGGTTDGCYPYGGLLEDSAGVLYGTTSSCGTSGFGTVFRIQASGKGYKLLHNFAGGTTDGKYPYYTSLIMDAKGILYGNTTYGGASSYGIAYKLTKSGTLTLLWSFAGGKTDGCYPYGTLAMDAKGNLYGTAESCGASGYGTVWKLTKKGTETLLHSFAGGTSDGCYPPAGPILDKQGNLYGDTELCGASRYGTVFELDKKGNITLLHSFAGSDGEFPIGGLLLSTKGTLYGTTYYGGASNYGTVWQITK